MAEQRRLILTDWGEYSPTEDEITFLDRCHYRRDGWWDMRYKTSREALVLFGKASDVMKSRNYG